MRARAMWTQASRAFVMGLALPAMAATVVASADDTEIFFGQAATDETSSANAPNILFLLDDSLSMGRQDDGQVGTRLERLQDAMQTLLSQMTNVNVGIMTMNGQNGGGPIRYPVSALDKPVCLEDDDCPDIAVFATINDVDNDTEERISNGRMAAGGRNLSVGGAERPSGNNQYVGLRFTDLDIPQGARITGAYLDMTAQYSNSGTAEWTIWGDDSDTAAEITTNRGDLSSRALTAGVSYNPGAWVEDEVYTSANLASVVQEIVDRPGWCGGNDMAFVLGGTDSRSIVSLESSIANAANDVNVPPAQLRITYEDDALPAGKGCRLTTVVGQAISSYNDGYQHVNGGVNRTNTWVALGSQRRDAWIGAFRYRFVDVPQGAEIVDARLDFHVERATTDNLDVRITGHANNSSGSIQDRWWRNISNRPRTRAFADWSHTDDVEVDQRIVTGNIAPVVQEIVDRPGWKPNNYMMMLLHPNAGGGHMRVSAFERVRGNVSKIYVTYKTYSDGSTSMSTERTARDELRGVIDRMQLNYWTPLLSQQYEAASYFLGNEVTYGRRRGGQAIVPTMRVSHPDSYTGGKLYTPFGCSELDPFNSNCAEEEIFDGAGGSVPTYITPIEDACQTNHIVLLSDGAATADSADDLIRPLIGKTVCDNNDSGSKACGTDLQRWLFENDHAPHIDGQQNVTTHTVAFNLTGDGRTYLESLAREGGGDFRDAASAEELVDAFTSIISGAQSIETSFTGPGATVNQFNRLSHREDVYLALFKPKDTPQWQGNLKRYTLGVEEDASTFTTSTELLDAAGANAIDPETGFFSDSALSLWDHINEDGRVTTDPDGANVPLGGAGSRIGANGIDRRKMYTFLGDVTTDIPSGGIDLNSGRHEFHESNRAITAAMLGINDAALSGTERAANREALMRWIRGVDVLDDDNDGNKTEPRRHMGDPMHSQPVIVNYREATRDPANPVDSSVVYVATNDGVVHAIDSTNGNELWAFTPKELLSNHKILFDNSSSSLHPYGLDGGMTLWRDDPNEDLVVDENESVFLYIGMRRGGNNYYAFDISDKDNPKLAWVIKGGPDGGDPDFAELGQSWSSATHARIKDGKTERDVLIFGAGYDLNQDADPRRDANGNTVIMEHSADSVGRGLFIVDAATGEKIWSVSGPDLGTGANADQRFDAMEYSMPASIRVVDIELDGFADQLYAADTGGQIWRFDITGTSRDKLLSGGVVADLSTDDAAGHRRFYSEPDVALVQQNGARYLAISIGSGWRAHPLNDIVGDAQYVIRVPSVRGVPDGYGMQTADGRFRPITEDDLKLVNAAAGSTDSNDLTHGWYMRLPDDGEKVLGTSLIFRDVLYFTSYVPTPSVDACGVSIGSGYGYAVSIVDGSPVLDFDGDGKLERVWNGEGDDNAQDDVRYELKHQGPPPNPTLLFPAGRDPEVFIGTEKLPTDISSGTSRTFWVDTGPSYAEQVDVY